jgi:RHS repeat-associated protein
VWYDALGRLQGAVKTDGAATIFNWQYSYDPLGNIVALVDALGSAGATLSYLGTDRDRICRIGYGTGGLGGTACNVTHDGVGNVVEQVTRTGDLRRLNYFASGKLRGIIQGAAQARFRYDAFGAMEELDVTGVGVSDTRHDRQYGKLIELRQQGINSTATLYRKIPGPDGNIVASRRGTGNDWVFHFGEPRGNRFFTDQNGAFLQSVDYEPFGEANSSGVPPGSAQYTSWQWNSQDALAAFGLSHLGARLYDPVIGRFLSRDPLLVQRTAVTSNPYAFATNDPWNAADPSGLDCVGGIGQECQYLQLLNAAAFGFAVFNLVNGGGSGGPSATPPAPGVGTGPKTPAGLQLQIKALSALGYVPVGFNFDTFARGGADESAMLDAIAQYHSAERDAAIDAYNARLDRYADYSRAIGWTLLAIGTGGVAVSEGIGIVLASRGMLGAAEFFGYSTTVGAGGVAGVSANQAENEIEDIEALTADAAAAVGEGGGGVSVGGTGAGGGAGGGATGGTPPSSGTNIGPRPLRAEFAASENGEVFPIPRGATIGPAASGRGIVYRGGPGGPALNDRVTGLRIMDPTPPKGPSPGFPGGYANYGRETPGQPWQSVNPFTGRTISKNDPWWHWPILP